MASGQEIVLGEGSLTLKFLAVGFLLILLPQLLTVQQNLTKLNSLCKNDTPLIINRLD